MNRISKLMNTDVHLFNLSIYIVALHTILSGHDSRQESKKNHFYDNIRVLPWNAAFSEFPATFNSIPHTFAACTAIMDPLLHIIHH